MPLFKKEKKGVISCGTKKSFCSSLFIGKNRKHKYEGGEKTILILLSTNYFKISI
jgi:hypothetical protein